MAKKKTLPKLKKDAQLVVNEYIRLRDNGKPCISCGQYKTLQAGHYFPVSKYDGLRFNELNINGECAGCNCFDEGHLITYRENLIAKIGEDEYNKLYAEAMNYKKNGYKFSRSEVEGIINEFKLKIKAIQNE